MGGVPILFDGHNRIICPHGLDRVNFSAKIWGYHGTPGIPRDDRPVVKMCPSALASDPREKQSDQWSKPAYEILLAFLY